MKKLTATLIVFVLSLTAIAQNKHEFSLHGSGGLSTLNQKQGVGDLKNGFGARGGLNYTFFFSPKWGLGTGFEFSPYHSKLNLGNLTNSLNLGEQGDGVNLEVRSVLNNYEETFRASFFQIPLMVQFRTGATHQYYVSLGGKIGLPIRGTHRASYSELQNTGRYRTVLWGGEIFEWDDNWNAFNGFGPFPGRTAENNLNLKPAFLAVFETGTKWRLSNGFSLYTGIYFDYGLNSIVEMKKPASLLPFMEFTPSVWIGGGEEYGAFVPAHFKLNNTLNSHLTQNGTTKPFVDKMAPIAAGIKISLTFGTGSSAKKKLFEEFEVTTAPINDSLAREAQRLADEEAARLANLERERAEALARAETQRLEQEREAERLAALERENARRKAEALDDVIRRLEKPIGDYFLAQVDLDAEREQEWNKKIELLHQHPELNVFIYGHTCDIGNQEANERIGLQRAQRVRNYLLSNGIAESRILGTVSKRDTEPLVPNTNERNRKTNRRAGLVVQR